MGMIKNYSSNHSTITIVIHGKFSGEKIHYGQIDINSSVIDLGTTEDLEVVRHPQFYHRVALGLL